MAFPASWPPRPASTGATLRFYVTDTATANFSDKAYMFAEQAGASPFTPVPVIQPGSNTTVNLGTPMGGGLSAPTTTGAEGPKAQIWSNQIRIVVTTADLEYSFDGTNVHGRVTAGTTVIYEVRREAGIAVRGAGAVYRIEAW